LKSPRHETNSIDLTSVAAYSKASWLTVRFSLSLWVNGQPKSNSAEDPQLLLGQRTT